MGRMWSPQDPLFFSHHAFIDKLWYNHQDCHDHKNKDAAMWQEVITDRYRIPTSKDQELPFCMPKRFSKMTWAKEDFQTFLANKSPKNTEWCGSKPKSRYGYLKFDNIQFSSDALSSWTDNYRLGDWLTVTIYLGREITSCIGQTSLIALLQKKRTLMDCAR